MQNALPKWRLNVVIITIYKNIINKNPSIITIILQTPKRTITLEFIWLWKVMKLYFFKGYLVLLSILFIVIIIIYWFKRLNYDQKQNKSSIFAIPL